MSNLNIQVKKLKDEFGKYNESLEVIVLDNGEELKFRGRELFQALNYTLKSDYDHAIIRALKEHEIVKYSGSGNMPQLIKSILKSIELHRS